MGSPYSLGRAEDEPDRGHEKSAAVFTGRSNDPTLDARQRDIATTRAYVQQSAALNNPAAKVVGL